MATPASDSIQQSKMSAQNINADILKKISRRNWLRNTAITATGTVMLPSFLTGCTKEATDSNEQIPNGGLGSVESPTQAQLIAAAATINNMRALMTHLYDASSTYDSTVLEALGSTRANSNWTGFIVDVFIDIAAAFSTLALPENGVAIGFLGKFAREWGIGKNVPPGLSGANAFFSEYTRGQQAMGLAIDQKLGHFSDVNYPANDYANLKVAWNDVFVFMGSSYTVSQLAGTHFPEKEDNADAYYAIFNSLFLHHKKAIWNLAIMKCCEYYENDHYKYLHLIPGEYQSLTDWARKVHYKQYPGTYVRAKLNSVEKTYDGRVLRTLYEVVYWNLGIGGNLFPQAAIDALFVDATPGNIINPDGLFNRNYVFQQFAKTKPLDFLEWHELGQYPTDDFNGKDDWDFTGGMFPKLTEP